MNKQLLKDIDTPRMLLDLDKLENNIKDIVDFSNVYNVVYRPHIKTHNNIKIANKQTVAGTIGITDATVGEAETMSEGKKKDILIAFPVAIKEKVDLIEKLINQSKITVAVDSISQAN